jgi:hypothetical protein
VKRLVGLLLFLILAEDTTGLYATHLPVPLGWVRGLLLDALPIKIRPVDLLFLGILIVASGKKSGRGGNVPPMRNALLFLLGATVFYFAYGLFHGGDARYASWQTYLIISSVLVAFTISATHRTPSDYVSLSYWLMGVAVYRAFWCWVSYFTWGHDTLGDSGAFLTSHDDTISWVVGIMVLIVNTLYRRSTAGTLRNLALILFLLGAIQFNSRRLAWVSLAMGLAVMYFLFPPGTAKRRITRVLKVALPIVLLYVVVGWGSQSPIFLPLRSFATVSTQEDGSTLARNAENLGLVATTNAYGFGLGSGWGKPYICLTRKYDIAAGFELWEYIPHNSILGLLAFTGVVGSAVFWVTVATGVFFNVRIARLSADTLARNVAIIGAAQVIVCLNQLYGDMGIFFFKPMYHLAISYAIALRLPRASGVWSTPVKAAPAPAPAPAPVPVR